MRLDISGWRSSTASLGDRGLVVLLSVPLSLAFAFLCAPNHAAAQTLSLREAYSLALERNHDLRTAQEELEQGRLLKRKAITVLFPTLTATAGYLRQQYPDGTELDGSNWGLNLSQTVYNGGRVWVAKKGAEYTYIAAEKGLEFVRQSILMDLVARANSLLSAEDILLVSQKRVERVREQLRQAEARLELGDVPRTAVLSSRVALSNAEMQEVESRKSASLARRRLAEIMGSEVDVRVTMAQDPTLPEGLSLEDLLETAVSNRADLAQGRELIRIAEQEAQLAARSDNPNIDITGSYTRYSNEDVFMPESQVGITLTWPFFQGGLVGLQTKEALSRVRQAEERYGSQVDAARMEVERAWLDLEALKAQANLVSASLSNAVENHRLARTRFDLGAAVILDVLAAEEDLAEAEYMEVQHRYQTRTARAALLYSIGSLGMESFDKEIGTGSLTR